MAKSEMNFYKIDEQNFIFSVKASSSDTIRYYQAIIGEDSTCNVQRIKNAFSFISPGGFSKVEEFSADYMKIITSLIDYCETDSRGIDFDERRKKAVAYSKLLRDISGSDTYYPNSERLLTSSTGPFYEVGEEDREYISWGIYYTNIERSFRIK